MKVYIGPYEDEVGQTQEIEIHHYDTWSMDYTLAPIILPMLIQLKETKHGAPNVDMSDVPEELRCNDINAKKYWTNGETDEKFFDRWDWIMGEMIWAFEQKVKDNWEDEFYGPHIPNDEGGIGGFEWIDHDGLKAHQDRMSNGFRLFGKYYENLWD